MPLPDTILVNTLAHAAGVSIFGIFIVFYLRDRHGRAHTGLLPVVAALLALAWNLGSLAWLAMGESPAAEAVLAASFCALNAVPAVLLHIYLERRAKALWLAGYALAGVAVVLHASELLRPSGNRHSLAILAVTFGFGLLTPAAAIAASRRATPAPRGSRLVAAMCLSLLAISFVHFSSHHGLRAWPGEVLLHHVGIPLALVFLLQNFRFLLFDAFVAVVANGTLAALFTVAAVTLEERFGLMGRTARDPFLQGISIVCLSLLLIAFAFTRKLMESALERFAFRRGDLAGTIAALTAQAATAATEAEFLDSAASAIGHFIGAERFEAHSLTPRPEAPAMPDLPQLVTDSSPLVPPVARHWPEVLLPLRFTRGDACLILLGRRAGGRRYLSGDLEALGTLAAAVSESVEKLRERELQRLISQAEFRALQSQINPHFLFNALTAVYGTIPKSAPDARQAVLNLSEMLRYSFRQDRTLVSIAQELDIIRAYLALESLRLGPRLNVKISVDEGISAVHVPALSIQPLVENAVKHGIASKPGNGRVEVAVKRLPAGVRVEVTDTGGSFEPGLPADRNGGGVGLDNVRQRLRLCYGPAYTLGIESRDGLTTAAFEVPAPQVAQVP